MLSLKKKLKLLWNWNIYRSNSVHVLGLETLFYVLFFYYYFYVAFHRLNFIALQYLLLMSIKTIHSTMFYNVCLLNKPHKKIFVYNVLYVNMNYPSFVCFFLFLLYLTRKNCSFSFYHRTLLRLEASIYWKSLKTSTHVLNE